MNTVARYCNWGTNHQKCCYVFSTAAAPTFKAAIVDFDVKVGVKHLIFQLGFQMSSFEISVSE